VKTVNFFLDTEFIESPNTIDVISIGLVCEDDSKLYLVNTECDCRKASDWVYQNVLLKMPEYDRVGAELCDSREVPPQGTTYRCCGKSDMARYLYTFVVARSITRDKKPSFWGYYSSYDWVVMCWLFGAMVMLPEGFPMYCNDIMQLKASLGAPQLPKQPVGKHNALHDAMWNKEAYDFLVEIKNGGDRE